MGQRVYQFLALVGRQPGNELFRFSLAQALVAEGRHDEAVPHFRFCVEQKGDWMMPRILLAKSLLALHRREEARTFLEQALELAIQQHHEEPEAEARALLRELT
jgi:Flp pilus assembly protein TadD